MQINNGAWIGIVKCVRAGTIGLIMKILCAPLRSLR
jgi:hypothetical protein